jgi:hypothetical protein
VIDPVIREISVEFARTIAQELMRSDQNFVHVDLFGEVNISRLLGVSVAGRVTQAGEDLIERYVRRAIEADRKARACPAGE